VDVRREPDVVRARDDAVLAVTAEQDFGRAITERTRARRRRRACPWTWRVLADLDHLLVVGEALPGVFAFFDGKPVRSRRGNAVVSRDDTAVTLQ
jgi:hypothetical protein